MASPTDSVAPDAPTSSSTWAGAVTLWSWFTKITDWIKALSPNGASTYDTGWVTLTPNATFPIYGTQPIEARRVGMHVEINGVVKTVAAGQLSGTICVLPADMRPKATNYFVCQGSGNNKWTIYVYANGNVDAARYGPDTPGSGTWLPFTGNWLVG